MKPARTASPRRPDMQLGTRMRGRLPAREKAGGQFILRIRYGCLAHIGEQEIMTVCAGWGWIA
jgi:hypothetical protein